MKRVFWRILIYILLFIFILVYGIVNRFNTSLPYLLIGTLGTTSITYVVVYVGIKLGRVRLRKESRVREYIKKIHIPGREICIHVCIFLSSFVIMSFNPAIKSNDNSIMQEKKVDKVLLQQIEKEYGRTDIKSIIEIDGRYIITFVDGSKKVMESGK